MGAISQYLKDTRAELNHVAWPTRTQTIVYTVLVAVISLGVAAYLGFFDFIFTTGLSRIITNLPASGNSGVTVETRPVATTSVSTTSATGEPLTLPISGSPAQQ